MSWDPASGTVDRSSLEGADVVVHLAGEPIDARWTATRKRSIRDSRVASTAALARALAAHQRPPAVLLSASAIGYYGDRGDEWLNEESAPGSGFLSETAVEWERATQPAAAAGVRVVLLRSGVVLSPRGGALARMLLPFELGVGGRLGSGRQWMSWITLHDWVQAALFLIESEIAGPVNLVAPEPVRNAEFTATLGRVLRRPAFIPVPALALELLFGSEMAHSTILASQRVHPQRLLASAFRFEHATVAEGLQAELEGRRNGGAAAITRSGR